MGVPAVNIGSRQEEDCESNTIDVDFEVKEIENQYIFISVWSL